MRLLVVLFSSTICAAACGGSISPASLEVAQSIVGEWSSESCSAPLGEDESGYCSRISFDASGSYARIAESDVIEIDDSGEWELVSTSENLTRIRLEPGDLFFVEVDGDRMLLDGGTFIRDSPEFTGGVDVTEVESLDLVFNSVDRWYRTGEDDTQEEFSFRNDGTVDSINRGCERAGHWSIRVDPESESRTLSVIYEADACGDAASFGLSVQEMEGTLFLNGRQYLSEPGSANVVQILDFAGTGVQATMTAPAVLIVGREAELAFDFQCTQWCSGDGISIEVNQILQSRTTGEVSLLAESIEVFDVVLGEDVRAVVVVPFIPSVGNLEDQADPDSTSVRFEAVIDTNLDRSNGQGNRFTLPLTVEES